VEASWESERARLGVRRDVRTSAKRFPPVVDGCASVWIPLRSYQARGMEARSRPQKLCLHEPPSRMLHPVEWLSLHKRSGTVSHECWA
jgi:hypothetical protein